MTAFDKILSSVIHHFGGGVYAKQVSLAAGEFIVKHTHNYNHLSILASGTVDVFADGTPTRYTGPACIEIVAGVPHEVFASTDAVWFCIHATDETDDSAVDEVLMAKGVS